MFWSVMGLHKAFCHAENLVSREGKGILLFLQAHPLDSLALPGHRIHLPLTPGFLEIPVRNP